MEDREKEALLLNGRNLNRCRLSTWEFEGKYYIAARFDDGKGYYSSHWPAGPVATKEDWAKVAESVGNTLSQDVDSMEHDGEFVHATLRQR